MSSSEGRSNAAGLPSGDHAQEHTPNEYLLSSEDYEEGFVGIDPDTFRSAAEEYRSKNLPHQSAPSTSALNLAPSTNVIFKSAAAFCAEYVPAAYVVEPMMRSTSLYTLTAKTGSGKTALLITTALAVVTGRTDILQKDVHKGRVAYLVFENPDDFRVRLAVAAFILNINLDEYMDQFVILDMRHKPEDIINTIKKMAEVFPFTLIIVDTLAAFFDGKDANDAVDAGNFMRRLRPLTQIAGSPTVLVASHPVKNAGKDNLIPYGSGAILNEVDGNLTLWRDEATGYAKLHWQGKFRGMEFEPMLFRFEYADHPEVLDAKGRGITVPVLLPVNDAAVADREELEEKLDQLTLRALRDQPGINAEGIGKIISRSTTAAGNRLNKLKGQGLVDCLRRKWCLSRKGRDYLEMSGDPVVG